MKKVPSSFKPFLKQLWDLMSPKVLVFAFMLLFFYSLRRRRKYLKDLIFSFTSLSNMFSFLLVLALFASSTAFSLTGASSRSFMKSSLQMGTIVDNIRFKKHFNRFTFKTLYKCVAACGLEGIIVLSVLTLLFLPTSLVHHTLT